MRTSPLTSVASHVSERQVRFALGNGLRGQSTTMNKPDGADSTQCSSWHNRPSPANGTSVLRLDEVEYDQDAKEEVDLLLAESMAALSFQERQLEQEELHGVRPQLSEDMEMIQRLANELDIHLNRLKAGTAYEAAESTDSAYAKGMDFRLLFLRCNRYDPQASAAHLIKFMDAKLKLFGKAKLVQDITLRDLGEDDREVVRNGHLQVLQGCDQSGRRIILEFPALRSFKTLMNELRARFYIYMDAAKSPDTQRKGVVMVTYGVGTLRERLRGIGFVEISKVALSVPLHFAGIHLATDDLGHYVLLKGVLAIAPVKLRTRFKLHHGSHMECQYRLTTYGIPRELLPLTEGDEAILEYHLSWYNSRLLEEGSVAYVRGTESSNDQIDEPRLLDVLFGKRINRDGGNRTLRSHVQAHSMEYECANKTRKLELVEQVINDIQSSGGRFLVQEVVIRDDTTFTTWRLLRLDEVRGKIHQAFRNHRRPRVALQEQVATIAAAASKGTPSASVFVEPGPNDVLFGRKRSNTGNKRVRQLVGALSDDYDSATTKVRKRQIANSVVEEIQNTGGRFLMQPDGTDRWEEVPNEFARNKIIKHFQNQRRPRKSSASVGSSQESNS
eukprot:scaffold22625_cov174-Cylindrotheca_fusiformis.AAC.2